MLTSLQVRNFAIIDEADLEFDRGMTVLTGETGAGKSILVDALGLVLGDRGGSGLVRGGARRAEFAAEFDIGDLSAVRDWLDERALDLDGACVLRRVINADGRSRAFINGNAVPLQSLRELGEQLLDIHGQHFHQSLGRRHVQRDLLDRFGDLNELVASTAESFDQWRELSAKLQALREADADRAARLDLLSFQSDELDALGLRTGELEALLSERLRLSHAGALVDGVAAILENLFERDAANANSLVADACRRLEPLIEYDQALEPALSLLQDAGIQISEATDALRRYGETLDLDPARRDQVEERLDTIQTIARKHRVAAEKIPQLHTRIRDQLHDLEHAEERGAELEAAEEQAAARYREAAESLSRGRQQAASGFSGSVSAAMSDLGMPGGNFEIAVRGLERDEPRRWGLDEVEFMISANPGQALMPLRKVASGGELSRMSLAIQVIASDCGAIPTMIFDEVDSGVGGGVAEMVGLRLHELGMTRQVFCVTHLPQVAGVADHHFRIHKVSDGNTTRTGVRKLNDDERLEELARMLGGVEITQRTRDHAAEMLRAGRNRDKSSAAP